MNRLLRYTPAQAAEAAGRHVNTIHLALEAGDLHGGQRVKRGKWSIRVECLEAWLDGEKCPHQQVPAELRSVS